MFDDNNNLNFAIRRFITDDEFISVENKSSAIFRIFNSPASDILFHKIDYLVELYISYFKNYFKNDLKKGY